MVILTATAVGATTAAKMLAKPFNDLYETAKGGAKSIISKWNAAGQRDHICQQISEVELVRTINSHNLIPLSEFYYPSRTVKSDGRGAATVTNSLDDIAPTGNVIILGTVGQGKSIFMRYLCISELRSGKKIPIFIELREIDKETNLDNLIIYKLQLLGLNDVNLETLSFLLDHGSFIFFLDGFDEIKREFAFNVQKRLSALIKKHPKTRWVVSSRPGSLGEHISTLPSFLSVSLSSIKNTEFDNFFKALKVPDELRLKLLNAIDSSPSEIKHVLSTPLMLTLLNMTFGTSTFIPNTLHEFYEAMFHVLVSRHDETKTAFVREKVTSLSNGELQNVFEHFCYLSKDFGNSLSDEQFAQCAKNSAKLTNMDFTPEGLKAELSETICLMLKDGLKISFIHKSVQEFFAAFFIKKLGHEEQVSKIYNLLRISKFTSWSQELKFLEEIDKYRFIQHFRLPEINDFFIKTGFNKKSTIRISKTSFRKFLAVVNFHALSTHSDVDLKSFIMIIPTSSNSQSSIQWLNQSRPGAVIEFDVIDDLYESVPKSKIIRFDKFLERDPKQFEDYREKLIAFCEKLDKERIKSERLLKSREKSFSEILGL